MAVMLSPKPASGIRLYSWAPDLAEGDSIYSYILTPTTVTIQADDTTGDTIEFYAAGGTAGNVYKIAAFVNTSYGETIIETLYVPVYGPDNAFTATAGDVINYALRPVVGLTGSATDDEKVDALEWLNGLLASWRDQGADVGALFPLTLTSTMYCSDAHLLAIKNNLRVMVAEQYGRQVAPATAMMAQQGLAQIKYSLLPSDRGGVDYY